MPWLCLQASGSDRFPKALASTAAGEPTRLPTWMKSWPTPSRRGYGRDLQYHGVYALYDADDAQHEAIATLIKAEPGPLFLPVILLAEIDYLLNRRLGHDAAFEFIEAVEQGDFTLVALSTADFVRCREVVAQYRALEI